MAETFQLNIVYRAEDRAFLAALKRELAEAKKLEKTLGNIRRLNGQQGGGGIAGVGGTSAAARMSRDYDRLATSIARADRAQDRMNRNVRRSSLPAALGSSGPLAFVGRGIAPAAMGLMAAQMGRAYYRQWAAEDTATAYMRSIGGSSQLAGQLAGLGNRYGKNRTDIILGGYQALSSGVSGDANVRSVVQNATMLASTNPLATVEDSVKALTLAANAYAKNGIADFSTANMRHTADMLARTVEKGVIEMPDLTAQLGDPLSVAPMAGVTMKEVLATMGTMSLKGINAAEGATATKNLISKIINPTDESRELARALGVDLSKGGLAKAGGLPQLMGQLVTAANKKGDAGLELLLDVFPELRAAKAALAGFTDPAMWNDFAAALDNSSGAAQRMADIASDNVSSQLKILGNNITDAAMKAGEASGVFGSIKRWASQNNERISGAAGDVYASMDANAPAHLRMFGIEKNPFSYEAQRVLSQNAELTQQWDAAFAKFKKQGMSDLDAAKAVTGTLGKSWKEESESKYGSISPSWDEVLQVKFDSILASAMNMQFAAMDPKTAEYQQWRTGWRESFMQTTGIGGSMNPVAWKAFNAATDNPENLADMVKRWQALPQEGRTGWDMGKLIQFVAGDTKKSGDPELQAFNDAIDVAAAKQTGAADQFSTTIIGSANTVKAILESIQPPSATQTVISRAARGTGGVLGWLGRGLVPGNLPG